MKHKRKLLASATCEGEGSRAVSTVDRFSDLPKGVAHHIASFLSIRDLTRFSAVSKRCRELYLSAPTLTFDDFIPARKPTGEYNDFSEIVCEVRLSLLNSLDRFLLRRGDNKIQTFRLWWDGHLVEDIDSDSEEIHCFCVNEQFRILTWIHNAVRCNVEVLNIEISTEDIERDYFTFPLSVFRCATLRSLVADMNHTNVKTPSFALSSNLEYLELRNVSVEDDEFFGWVSSCCKFLKELHLCDVWGIKNITIKSSSLEKIYYLEGACGTCRINISGQKVEDITLNWRFSVPSMVSLRICAPNLKNLCWSGNLMNHAKLGKFEFLETASICMEPEVDDANNLPEAFCSLSRVVDLVLNEATIKALFKEGSIHAQLDNLCTLQITIGSFSDELMPAVVSLLRGMPNLCSLYIWYHPGCLKPKSDGSQESGIDMDYWKLQNLVCIHQLEEVVIELSHGSNGIEFARYILEHAEDLEEMIIIYLPGQSNVIQELNESKMKSKATVTFQEE